jgi:phage gp29-like protein
MPPDVGPDDEAVFLAAAQAVAEGGSGALPAGSSYAPNTSDKGRGADPFETHLDYWSKKLVLVGTNGLLTMLTESGSGTLAGGAHSDTFQTLARSDARQISEIIQRQLVEPYLRAAYPGRPIAAYWQLAYRDEVDASQVVADAATLFAAGYQIDQAELGEKTGYTLRPAPVAAPPADDLLAGAMRLPPVASQPETSLRVANRETPPSESSTAQNTDDPETPDPAALQSLLRTALAGGLDAWTDTLALALAEGLSTDPSDPSDPSDQPPTTPAS